MALRARLDFRLDESSWTETYYLAFQEEPVRDTLSRLVRERLRLMAIPTLLHRGSIIDLADESRRYSTILDLTSEYWAIDLIHLLERQVFAGLAGYVILMRVRTATGKRRSVWIDGIPDQVAENLSVGNRKPSEMPRPFIFASMHKRLQRWSDELFGEDLALQVRTLRRPPDVLSANVLSVGTDANGLYRITTDQDFALAPQTPFVFRGCRGSNLSRLRGSRRILAIQSPRDFSCDRGSQPERGPIRYSGGATVTQVAYTFEAAQPGDPPFELLCKKTGSRTFGRRGRRPATK